jgi:hypothetical protein
MLVAAVLLRVKNAVLVHLNAPNAALRVNAVVRLLVQLSRSSDRETTHDQRNNHGRKRNAPHDLCSNSDRKANA